MANDIRKNMDFIEYMMEQEFIKTNSEEYGLSDKDIDRLHELVDKIEKAGENVGMNALSKEEKKEYKDLADRYSEMEKDEYKRRNDPRP